jgi:hypothetical protein
MTSPIRMQSDHRWCEQDVLNLNPLGHDLMEYMEGVGLTGPHVSPDRVLAVPRSLSPNFKQHLELDTWLMWIT